MITLLHQEEKSSYTGNYDTIDVSLEKKINLGDWKMNQQISPKQANNVNYQMNCFSYLWD